MHYLTLFLAVSAIYMVTLVQCDPALATIVNAKTNFGPVRGQQYKIDDKFINAYFGIPYAKPPTGPLRFKSPQPTEQWTNYREAIDQPNCCVQPIENLLSHALQEPPKVSEDCLYLNVWTTVTGSSSPALPVIVIIHGGGFAIGCINMKIYDGMRLASSGKAVVVSFNYRLGALGFLNLGIEGATGNMGLLDQQSALRWIHNNIKYFGGDPSKITIFGDSSGGSSVAYHILSDGSKDLFAGAFIQSGNILSSFGFVPNRVIFSSSMGFANYTGCPTSPESALECLMKKTGDDVIVASEGSSHFGPSIDGVFISKDPRRLLEEHKVPSKVPIITGITKNEGSLFVAAGFLPCSREVASNNITNEVLFLCARAFLRIFPDEMVHTILDHYRSSIYYNPLDLNRNVMLNIVGDVMFVCPSREFINLYSIIPGTQVHSYVFDYVTQTGREAIEEWMGVIHGSDFSLLLNKDLLTQDQVMAEKMVGLITGFAAESSVEWDSKKKWVAYKAGTKNFLYMDDKENSRLGFDFHGANCDLLRRLEQTLPPPPQFSK